MINWKTILSVFDGKPTLLQYLKKVLKALEETALNGLRLNYNENAQTLSVSALFADGQEIASEPITLNIPIAETILEAIKGVEYSLVTDPSSLDVFEIYNALSIRVDYPDGEHEIFAGIDLWDWLTTNLHSYKTERMFTDSADITITAADTKHLYAQLTQEVKQILSNVQNYLLTEAPRNLKTPMSAPSEDSVVLVNTANAEEIAPLERIYRHTIAIAQSEGGEPRIYFDVLSTSATPLDVMSLIYSNDIISFGPLRGDLSVGRTLYPVFEYRGANEMLMQGLTVYFISDTVTPFMIGE